MVSANGKRPKRSGLPSEFVRRAPIVPESVCFTVLEWLRANDSLALIPVIVVSARDRHANEERALKAGAKAFLQKPVDNAELLGVVRKVLGETTKVQKSEVYNLGDL